MVSRYGKTCSTNRCGIIPRISLRPVTDDDQEFLFQLYASTRAEEKELVGWPDELWDQFMRMQFDLQQAHYRRSYDNPSFDIILGDETPIGRLYLDRRADEYRLIDLALLPQFRGLGIGGNLLKAVVRESEEQGLPVSLHVEKNNPILDYYRRIGFRIAEDRGAYFYMIRTPAATASPAGDDIS
ncbi:MAG: GNAT family N-acetyltransferase [Geobacter sp.]|nr:GNAT family N-acetyltransferase [Geobacter sp.]